MRRALRYLVVFLCLLVVVAGAAVLLIPRDQVVALVVDKVRAETGRDLVLAGDIAPSFWPVLGVRTGAVRFSNAEWGEAADMVSASAAEIGVELMPLLSGEINVMTLRLVEPVVALEIGPDGRANWVFDEDASGGGTGGARREAPKISLPEAVISKGTISFRDARTGRRIELAALDLTAGIDNMQAPLRLDGAGLWNGKRARLAAVVDTPAALMAGERARLRLTLDSDPADLSFEGDLALGEGAALPAVNGAVSARLASAPAALAWATGSPAPAAMAELGAVTLDGNVAATESVLALAASGSVGYRGRAVAFDVKADGGAGWRDRRAFTVEAAARSEGLFDLSFSGPVNAGAAPAAEGPLRLAVSDVRGLVAWAGGSAPDLPKGTFESVALDAGLSLKGPERIGLAGVSLRLGRTPMAGDASVYLGGARPLVNARLESGPLDLSPFMAKGGAGGGGRGPGWSTEPLDLAALRALEADARIRAEAVDLGDIELGRSEIDMRLRGGRLDLTIRRLEAYGGGMDGTVTLVAGDEAELATDVTVSGVQLRPLLAALAGFDSLEGLGNFRIRANGRGRSMDALMRSLDGQGMVDLADGAILGMNLAAMVRNLTGQGGALQKTDFSAVSGTFDITDGVLHNTDFSFLGPLLRVKGAGTVDLGRQTQNFRLEPTAVASLTGQGGALTDAGLGIFPIFITGTWSNPSFRPDLTAAVEALVLNPDGTVAAVKRIIEGADAGDAAGALLGAAAGGDRESPAGALGQVLGGVLSGAPGGSGAPGDDGRARTGGAAGALGGLLGALGGGDRSGGERSGGGRTGGQPGERPGESGATVSQPTYEGTVAAADPGAEPGPGAVVEAAAAPAWGAGALAPVTAPLPVPSEVFRAALAALSEAAPALTAPAGEAATVPMPGYSEEIRPAAPEPAPAATEPAAALEPAAAPEPATVPQTQSEPAAEPPTVPQPQAEPTPAAEPAPAPEPAATAEPGAPPADDQARPAKRQRERDGGLNLQQILKGLNR